MSPACRKCSAKVNAFHKINVKSFNVKTPAFLKQGFSICVYLFCSVLYLFKILRLRGGLDEWFGGLHDGVCRGVLCKMFLYSFGLKQVSKLRFFFFYKHFRKPFFFIPRRFK
jgi:hypothetical protein